MPSNPLVTPAQRASFGREPNIARVTVGLGGGSLAIAPAPSERSDVKPQRRTPIPPPVSSPQYTPQPGRPYRPRKKVQKAAVRGAGLILSRWIPQVNLLMNVYQIASAAADALEEWQLAQMAAALGPLYFPGSAPVRRKQQQTVAPPAPKPRPQRKLSPAVSPNPLAVPAAAPAAAPIPAFTPAPAAAPVRAVPPPAGAPPARKTQAKPKKLPAKSIITPEELLKTLLGNPAQKLQGLTSSKPSKLGLAQESVNPTVSEQTQTQQNSCAKGGAPKRKKGECRQGYFSEKPDGTTVYKTWSTRKCGTKLRSVK